jgi:hypothetical protein
MLRWLQQAAFQYDTLPFLVSVTETEWTICDLPENKLRLGKSGMAH